MPGYARGRKTDPSAQPLQDGRHCDVDGARQLRGGHTNEGVMAIVPHTTTTFFTEPLRMRCAMPRSVTPSGSTARRISSDGTSTDGKAAMQVTHTQMPSAHAARTHDQGAREDNDAPPIVCVCDAGATFETGKRGAAPTGPATAIVALQDMDVVRGVESSDCSGPFAPPMVRSDDEHVYRIHTKATHWCAA